MIESMTGFGRCERSDEHGTVLVEVRGVNGKYVKVLARLPDLLARHEADVEALVRSRVNRGTVTVSVDLKMTAAAAPYRINTAVVKAYADALGPLRQVIAQTSPLRLEALAALPGAMEPVAETESVEAAWRLTAGALEEALSAFLEMRRTEGAALAAALSEHVDEVERLVERVAAGAPRVVAAWRDRLRERVQALTADAGLTISDADLAREVAFFAERSDIAEELNRCRSHVRQFREALRAESGSGRTIEFLVQEMHREASTMGAKANDAELGRDILALKGEIDRIREQVQNVA